MTNYVFLDYRTESKRHFDYYTCRFIDVESLDEAITEAQSYMCLHNSHHCKLYSSKNLKRCVRVVYNQYFKNY